MELTHLDQQWWPGVTKRDVLAYYADVAPVLLPHLRDRPFTIKQHYNGPRSPFRWLKDKPAELPEWVPVTPQPAKSRHGALVRYPLVQNVDALLAVVNLGSIDLHVWSSRRDRPDRPDYVLFDLDPHGVPFAEVVRGAHLLRDALEALGLESHAKTTGGDGLHVQVPVARRHTYDDARTFCRLVGRAVEAASRGLVSDTKRPESVFLDVKMNGHGQQLVAVYSVRPGELPAVATPVRWEELDAQLDPRAFTPAMVLERVRRLGDVHEPVLHGRQSLRDALARGARL